VRNVLLRIAVWASVGFLVSLGWGLYFAKTSKGIPVEPAVRALAMLTQPSAGAALYRKPSLPLGLTWVAVANAATYALFGLLVETIRQRRRLAH
jgi:hypothetical protein